MAGLYIHIPFCRQACSYCDFHFSISTAQKDSMLVAINKEIAREKSYLDGEILHSIYFGGGTPSILSDREIETILGSINKHYRVDTDAEITLEANPDDLSQGYLKNLRQTGVNRLSVGIQSFFDDDLKMMNRRHNAAQAIECLEHARNQGFNNFSIDLIYGLPGSDSRKWEQNLEKSTEINPTHISAYHLTYEPGTMLDHQRLKNRVSEKNENESLQQFKILMDHLELHGYEHYEISNFSLPGKYSRHNTAYWNNEKYLGAGPSAHSFDGMNRRWNIAKNASYIRGIDNGSRVYEEEKLDTRDHFNEYIMTALRTARGLDKDFIVSRFGNLYLSYLERSAAAFVESGKIMENESCMYLGREGKFIADYIIRELFFD